MSETPPPPQQVKKEFNKNEVTDFNEIYRSQPPDSVIIDGKKESLNLDIVNASRQVWLVKLPKFLAEKWNNIDDISGQDIGKLRIKQNSNDLKFKLVLNELPVDEDVANGSRRRKQETRDGSGDETETGTSLGTAGTGGSTSTSGIKQENDADSAVKKEKVKEEPESLKFEQLKMENNESGIPSATEGKKKQVDYFQNLPHEYDLRVTNKAVKNQFVFSEQNLNNFGRKSGSTADGKPGAPGSTSGSSNKNNNSNSKDKPKKLSRQKFWQQQQKLGINRYVPYVKSIPKKSALVGTICHECSVTPSISDQNYSKVLADRKNRIIQRPDKPTIQVLKESSGIIQRFSAPSLRGDDADAFIRANKEGKNKEGRAIRMERKELLDLLFKLFDEYDYWSMKGLKERVKQPEGWLKESLDSIAILIKRGPYASKYCLKPEYKKLRDFERAEKLKALGIEPTEPEEENKDDEEEEDVEMENVA